MDMMCVSVCVCVLVNNFRQNHTKSQMFQLQSDVCVTNTHRRLIVPLCLQIKFGLFLPVYVLRVTESMSGAAEVLPNVKLSSWTCYPATHECCGH